MICPKCDGTGFVPTNVFGVNGAIKCDFCDGTGVFITNNGEPQNNEEWFNTLTTEQKAEVIAQLSSYGGNVEAILLWLRQPHTTEEPIS